MSIPFPHTAQYLTPVPPHIPTLHTCDTIPDFPQDGPQLLQRRGGPCHQLGVKQLRGQQGRSLRQELRSTWQPWHERCTREPGGTGSCNCRRQAPQQPWDGDGIGYLPE